MSKKTLIKNCNQWWLESDDHLAVNIVFAKAGDEMLGANSLHLQRPGKLDIPVLAREALGGEELRAGL